METEDNVFCILGKNIPVVKTMIVCISRRICVELYKTIGEIRPDWHHDDDNLGINKMVITGSASNPLKHIPY